MAKLLLVDDEKEILEALELILESQGHHILTATTGQTALDILFADEDDKPDMIISDIVMPGMSGLDLLNALRASPDYARLPVIFISASISPDREAEIAEVAFVYFLRKPFEVDELCLLVDELVG